MFGWRERFFRTAENLPYVSWLTEPGSLTARCQRACGSFRVRLLGQRLDVPTRDEAPLFSGWTPGWHRGRLWVREVVLECDGCPVIFAHTTLPVTPRGRLSRWLARLGSRSLGSLLFAYPGFARGSIEIKRLDARHPLYRRAVAAGGVAGVQALWARRSMHHLNGQQVLVTEVFLPAIAALPGRSPGV